MGDITKNISRRELECHCGCGFDSMDYETIQVVQDCCDYFAGVLGIPKVTLRINSASRCFGYNRTVGSTDESQHPRSRAMDISIVGVLPTDIFRYLSSKYPSKYGIGLYDVFVHLDTRTNGPARW